MTWIKKTNFSDNLELKGNSTLKEEFGQLNKYLTHKQFLKKQSFKCLIMVNLYENFCY